MVHVDGNICKLKAPGGTDISNVHVEQCVLVPPVTLPTSHRPEIENVEEGEGPSLGECLDVPFNQVRAPEDKNRGMLDKVTVGVFVLYSTDKPRKKCRIGLVIAVLRTEGTITVHRLEPVSYTHLTLPTNREV